jgi:amidase
MALRLPTIEDLHQLAATNYFELSADEAADFLSLMPDMFESLDQLEQMPAPSLPLTYRERDPGSRPSPRDDPLNAIVRRCSVKGAPSGKLAGKRVGLKDNVCVAGIPMTCGSLVLDGYVADIDATIVTRLLDAGAEIVAMLNMDNFAFSGGGDTSAYGPTRNPHNPEHLAGGSSGGSAAALYYDDIDLTIGGDQGGSIRIPASWCGVVGLKPTHGLVPYTGIVGIDATFDHTGPMARSVADVALMLEVIAGKDPFDPRQGEVLLQPYTQALGQDIKGLRIGLLREGFGLERAEPDVEVAVRRAINVLQELGAQVQEVSVPAHREAGGITWGLIAEGTAAAMYGNGVGYHWKGLYNVSLATALGKSRQAQGNDLPPTLKLVSLIGTYLNQRYHGRLYGKAQNQRRALQASYDRALEQVDVLAMPTTPMKAHQHDPKRDRRSLITHGWNTSGNTAPFDMTGHPSLSIPCAKSNGLPVGLMLTGQHFDEATLLRVAHAFEQSVSWEKV